MATKGILFDKDGTLIDFQNTWIPLYEEASLFLADGNRSCAQKMLVASGYDQNLKKIISNTVLAQGTNDEIAEIWMQYAPDHSLMLKDAIDTIEHIFASKISLHATPVTNLKQLFACLQQNNIKLGVATSDSIKSANKSLEPFAIVAMLDFFVGYDSGFGRKPDTGMIEGFATATGLEMHEIMMVGDSPHDMEMGHAAGVGKNIGVLTGVSPREQLCDLADEVIDNISQLKALLNVNGDNLVE